MKPQSLKIYANSTALTVETQYTKSGEHPTIGLEAARKSDDGQHYDWQNKIFVQVTERELSVVLAVILGYQDTCEFRFHGTAHNKHYLIRSQQRGLLIEVGSAKGGVIRVPVSAGDTFALSVLVMRQLQRHHGGLPSDVLLTLLTQSFLDRSSLI